MATKIIMFTAVESRVLKLVNSKQLSNEIIEMSSTRADNLLKIKFKHAVLGTHLSYLSWLEQGFSNFC